MNNYEKLKIKVLELSNNANNFYEAIKEWELEKILHSEEPESCACSHFPIKELCFLKNNSTNTRLLVGNCCVKHFEKNYDWFFYNVKRIKKGFRPNMEMIEYLFKENIINNWEYDFLINMCNKKKLSFKQKNVLKDIIKKILNKL